MAYGPLYPNMMGGPGGFMPPMQQPGVLPMQAPVPTPRPMMAPPAAPWASRFADFLDPAVALPAAGAMMMGRNANESFGAGLMALGEGYGKRRDNNKTRTWLLSQGLSEADADAAMSNPAVLNHYLKMASDKKGGAADLGLNPQYGLDANGNPVLLQLGKDGKVVQSQMPEGVTLSKEPIKLDAGTHFVLLDPITRQPIGQIPKENQQAAFDTALGTGQGKAAAERIANAPQAIAKGEQALSVIDQLRMHPGRQAATGMDSIRGSIPGTQAYDFARLNDQLAGKAFLEAFESLKGGGQITEVEGRKATEAIARLDRAQTEEGYLAALKDLEDVIRIGIARAQQGVTVQNPAQSGGGNRTGTGIQWSVE